MGEERGGKGMREERERKKGGRVSTAFEKGRERKGTDRGEERLLRIRGDKGLT